MEQEKAEQIKEEYENKNFITREAIKQANNNEVTNQIFAEEGVDILC